MSSLHTQKIELSKEQQIALELIIRKRKSSQSILLRAKIILSGAEGKTSKELKCILETVTRWRKHWIERNNELKYFKN